VRTRLPQRGHVVDVDAEFDHAVSFWRRFLVERLQVAHDARLKMRAPRGSGRAPSRISRFASAATRASA
jgi:hypothetical protein